MIACLGRNIQLHENGTGKTQVRTRCLEELEEITADLKSSIAAKVSTICPVSGTAVSELYDSI